jgi:YbbR domain-containing protein
VAEVSWILGNWQLKLLALGLSVGLFAALAFSQNPIQFVTVNAKVIYSNPPTGLVVANPQPTTSVTLSGLAANIKNASVRAEVDLSKVKKGTITITPAARVLGDGVTAQAVTPVTFSVDDLATAQLDIEVRTPNVEQGWTPTKTQAVCGNSSQACKVTFTGPAALTKGLKAYVIVQGPINGDAQDELNVPVRFEQSGRPFDPTKITTIPEIGWNPATVTAHIEAKQGTTTKTVALVDAAPSAKPPSGYHVTSVSTNPQTIQVTGSPDVLAGIRSITLPAVDLSSYTSDHTFRLSIPSPDPSVQLSATVAQVTYSIAKNPAVTTSPSP